MDSRIYQDPDKADADEVLNLSDDVAQQAQSVSQLQSLVESQAQEVQALQSQLSSLSQALSSLQAQVSGMEPSVDKIPTIEESVTELSAGQSSQDFQIQGINSQLSGVESDVASLRDSVCLRPGAGIILTSYVSDLGGSHVTRVGTTCYLRLFLRVTHGFAANFNLTTLPADVRPPMWAFTTAEVTTSGVTSHVHGDVTLEGQVIVPKTMKEGDGILVWGAWGVER